MGVPKSQASAPPRTSFDLRSWLKENLFSSWYNTLLTAVSLVLIYALVRSVLVWAFTQAQWDVVVANLRLLMVGPYPVDQLWRVWLCVALAALLVGLSQGLWPDIMGLLGPVYGGALLLLALLPFDPSNRIWLAVCGALVFLGWAATWQARRAEMGETVGRWVGISWVVLLPLVLLLLRGVEPLLFVTRTQDWGGLLLTFVLAISAIVFSFPLGVLLAIGRRSELPVLSGFCTVYIETFRGVPLVTVLFMFLIMFPLFLPGSEATDNIIRAIVGFTLFTAAYIAENVRGGLQAIPKGQYEAARALGLNPLLSMTFIILPQALRIVIPANVNQFVSLFKDTSLVIVVGGGMRELLGIARNTANQSEFLGQWLEPLIFAAALYWIFCFSMTYVSRRLENKLSVATR
jgi:general L-amino acid transport system permease protein